MFLATPDGWNYVDLRAAAARNWDRQAEDHRILQTASTEHLGTGTAAHTEGDVIAPVGQIHEINLC
jgi:hypothetical protein